MAYEENKEWCDTDGRDDKTALWHKCGIDSVLGEATFIDNLRYQIQYMLLTLK